MTAAPAPAAPLTVVGSYLSPYVRKVLAVLELKGLPYQVDPIVPFYGNAEFARLSPARRVPVLIEGDFALADSTVILEYLDERWPTPPLWPADLRQRARARALEEYADSVLGEVFIWRFFNELVIRRFVWGQAPDAAVVEQARTVEIPASLDYLEAQLPEQGWLFDTAGGTPGAADIALAAFFRNLAFAGHVVDAARWPRTAGFVARTLAAPCLAALAAFEKLSARTPIAQQRAALIAAGAPIAPESLGMPEPSRGLFRR